MFQKTGQTVIVNPKGISNIKQIGSAERSTFFITDTEEIYATGENSKNQLSQNHTNDLTKVGKLYDYTGATYISDAINVMQSSANTNNTALIKKDGTVWVVGNGDKGQIGNDYYLSSPLYTRMGFAEITLNVENETLGVGESGKINVDIKNGFNVYQNEADALGKVKFSSQNEEVVSINENGEFTALKQGTSRITIKDEANALMKTVLIKVTRDADDVVLAEIYGQRHTILLRTDGSVITWGANDYGQLGVGHTGTVSGYVEPLDPNGVDKLTGIISVSRGANHTAAVKKDGTVLTWGLNSSGQLGNGNNTNQSKPVYVIDEHGNKLTDIVKVSCGNAFTLALRKDGTVWAWGNNSYGQLGNNTFKNSSVAVQVKDTTGSGFLRDVADISAGEINGAVLTHTKEVYVWGYNWQGEVGNGTTSRGTNAAGQSRGLPVKSLIENVEKVICNRRNVYAITEDRNLYAWGYNGYGQIGIGVASTSSDSGSYQRTKPTKVQLNASADLENVIDVGASQYTVYALLSDGTVYSWGENTAGPIGNNTTTHAYYPTELKDTYGADFTKKIAVLMNNNNTEVVDKVLSTTYYMICEDGKILGNGYQAGNRLLNTRTGKQLTPRELQSDFMELSSRVVTVKQGESVTLQAQVRENLSAFAGHIKLGNISYTSSNTDIAIVNNDGEITAVNLGEATITARDTTYGYTAQAIVKVIQNNEKAIAVPDITQGENFTVVLKADGTVWATGLNTSGQLGDGSTTNKTKPVQVKINSKEYLTGIVEISSGQAFTIALSKDGEVYAWGNNGYGQLGNGTTTKSVYATKMLKSDATGPVQNVIGIDAGSYSSYLLMKDGTVYSVGRNDYGQLGLGNNANKTLLNKMLEAENIVKVSAAHVEAAMQTGEGKVLTVGYNKDGELGHNATNASKNLLWSVINNTKNGELENIVKIAGGTHQLIALTENNKAYSWGYNGYGQLGNGTKANSSFPVTMKIGDASTDITDKVIDIGASYYTTMIKLQDKDGKTKVYVTGLNDNHQFGNGTNTNSLFLIPVKDKENVEDAQGLDILPSNPYGIRNAGYIDVNGNVWTVGTNANGQIGDDTLYTRANIVQIGELALKTDEPIIQLAENEEKQIKVSIEDTFNVYIKDITLGNLEYKSLDESVVTVDETGKLTAKGIGSTIVKVKDLSRDIQIGILVKVIKNQDDIKCEPMVVGGNEYSVALKADGTVWAWGYNKNGQLGNNSTVTTEIPTQVVSPDGNGFLTDVKMIASGTNHTLALKTDGTVWAWGYNNVGQLGDNTQIAKYKPVQVLGEAGNGYLEDIIYIAAGTNYSAAVNKNGEVWTWGNNSNGQLGDGTTVNKYTPVRVKANLTGVIGIACGNTHMIALKSDGTVYTWGYNQYGKLGDNSTTQRTIPVKMQETADTYVENAIAVEANTNNSYVLKADGTVLAVGLGGANGQLGDGTNTANRILPVQVNNIDGSGVLNNIKAIKTGANTAYALTKDNKVIAWGLNDKAQLGNDGTAKTLLPVEVKNDSGNGPLEKIIYIGAGANHALAVEDNGYVQVWGSNSQKQLSETSITQAKIPIYIRTKITATPSSVKMKTGDTQKLSIEMNAFNLFESEEKVMRSIEFRSLNSNIATVSEDGIITAVSNGITKVVAKDSLSGKVTSVDVSVLEDGAIATPKIASGSNHTVALKADGTVWTYGYNNVGQLGLGDTKTRYIPTKVNIDNVIDIACGANFSVALKQDGTVWTWGINDKGQLGQGNTKNSNIPVQVLAVGGSGTLQKVKKIGAGASQWTALLESGEVVSCGRNEAGDLCDGTTTNRTTPVYVLNHTGVGHVNNVRDISSSNCAILLLKEDGTVWAGGHNCQGQSGQGNTTANHLIKQVKDSTGNSTLSNIIDFSVSSHILALADDGTVWAWGYNNYGQIGNNSTTNALLPVKVKDSSGSGELSNIVKVEAGYYYSMAIADDGTVYAWGYNKNGQLGNNTTTTSKLPKKVLAEDGLTNFTDVMLVSEFGEHTNIAKTDGTVWTVGYNVNGELGDDTNITRKLVKSISNATLDVNEKYLQFTTIGETKKIEVKLDQGFNLLIGNTSATGNKFTSYNENIATVDEQGNVVSVGAGATYIKIENEGLGLVTTVKVVVPDREGTTIPKVVGGANHYVALKADGSVWTWGYNGNGQLGLGNTVNQLEPVFTGMENVIDIAAGANFTAILKKDGTVWVTGQNNYGQLGQNNTTGSNVFIQVKAENGIDNLSDIIAITASDYYMAALKKDGTVWTWGYNGYGQLGNNTTTASKLPTKVRKVNNIMQIAAGANHLVMLDSDSTVWTVGRNNNGQLGINSTKDSKLPVKMLDSRGQNEIKNIRQIATAGGTTYLLDAEGIVWGVGYNGYGQLTDGTTKNKLIPVQTKDAAGNVITDVVYVSGRNSTVGIVKKDGSVYTAGYNEYGAAGNGSKATNKAFTRVLGEYGSGLFENGLLIALTNNSSLVADKLGRVYTTGYNAYGQMGDGTINSSTNLVGISNVSLEVEEPIIVMNNINETKDIKAHMNLGFNLLYKTLENEHYTYKSLNKNIVSVNETGTVTALKYGNARIEVTNTETSNTATVIAKIVRDGDIANPKVESGIDFTVALKSNGTVYAWGYNQYGQLGLGDKLNRTEPTKIDIDNVVDIVCGNSHVLYLKQDGTVWASGLNNYGQLGDNTTIDRNRPVQVLGVDNIIKIAAGANHSLVLRSDGTVYSFGYNKYGQLGDTTTTRKSQAVQVKRLQDIKDIAAGNHSSLALDINGYVWGFGFNTSGQLGLGTKANALIPTRIETINNILEISCGENYGLAVSENGNVYSFGVNGNGQLGNNTKTGQIAPKLVIKADGGVLTNIEKVSAGRKHALAKTYDGKIYGWGIGNTYQFGNEATGNLLNATQLKYSAKLDIIENVLDVSAGDTHSVMVKEDGTVWVTGKNNYGQLGDSTTINKTAWICISDIRIKLPETSITIPAINGTYNLKPELEVGFNLLYDNMSNANYKYISKNEQVATVNEAGVITGLKQGKTKIGITESNTNKTVYVDVYVLAEGDIAFPQVITREYTTVALKSDGTVWTWGYNANGELGIDSTTNQIAPCKVDIEDVQKIAVGNNHVLALKADGTVWAWGSNSNGQLGRGDKVNSKVPVKVKNLKDIKEIAAGNGMSMAVDKDGKLFTWGLNDCGQLGINSKQEKLEPFLVEAISNISKIAAGNKSGYALTQEGMLYSFGNNNQGQLGDGTNTTRLLPVEVQNVSGVIDIAASSTEQAYALINDGTVLGWGYSSLGALTDVGGALPKALAGPDGRTRLENIASIDAGYYGAVAITDDGKALAWGGNGFGGLGNGTTAKSVAIPTYVKENGTDNLSNVFIASMGRNYSMYAKEDGSVWGTGYNEYGQLGNTSKVTVYTAENISNDHISTNCTEIVIKGVGNNSAINGKYVNGFNLYNRENSNPITYESQDENIVTVDQNGNLTATGLGKTYITLTAGGLGRRVEVNVLQDAEVAVMDLHAGNRHTIGLKTDGTIWSFGANSNGQLGIDSIDNKVQIEPIQVTAIPEGIKFTKIAVGKDHSLALGDNGKVYAWGANKNGQLGDGQNVDSGRLVEVRNLSNIETIVAYENMSYAIDKNGVAYVWGEGFTSEPQKISFFAKIIDISGRYLLSEYGTVWNVNNLEEKVAGLNNIVEIAAGDSHLLALDASSNVYGLGNNTYGQLGVAGVKNVKVPTLVKDASGNNITDIESVKASQYSSYILTKQGEVYSFGRNSNNALGIESKQASISVPTALDISNVERISAGQNYAVAVLDDGFTYSWGTNTYGQLGLGNKEETAKPTLIGKIKAVKEKDIVTIKIGESVSVPVSVNNTFNLRYDVVANDGFTFKSIDEGIAITNNEVVTGVKTGLTTVVAEHTETKQTANISVEVLKDDYKSVIDVVSGNDFTITLKADGTVWGWGANGAGQLANNTTVDVNQPIEIVTNKRIKQIAAGDNYIAILAEDGTVYTAGENTDGELGNGSNVNQKSLVAVIDEVGATLQNIVRVAIKNNTTYAQDVDGNVYAFGKNYYNVATKIKDLAQVAEIYGEYAITKENKVISLISKSEIAGLENIVKIAEGVNHTLFLTKDKTVYAMGQNSNGQCGTGTKTNCVVPTLVKDNIGTGNLQNARDISAGDNYSIAVLENGEVYTWGANKNNVLGTEQATAQILPRKNSNINEGMIVSAGYNHTVVAKTNGRVYAWGNNLKGSLGTGENTNSVTPVRVGSEEVKVNTNHLQIEKGNIDVLSGVIKSFNLINEENSDGVIYESKDESIVTVDKKSGVVRAVGIGNTSILVKQDAGTEFAIVQVTVLKSGTSIKPDVQTSNSHSVILKADGTVWTYGDNTYGELGNGTTVSQDNICKVDFENNVKITQIAVGESHTLALDETGVVWAFGRNNYYQLGTDKVASSTTPIKVKINKKVIKIEAGYNQSFAITEDNRLYVWGLNSNGELGTGSYEEKVLPTLIENVNQVLDVASGKTHTVIVTPKGNVYTTGNNSYSSLTGTEYKRNVFGKAEGLENIAYIEAGEYHNMALSVDDKLYAWGLNIYGQLGNGNANTIATPEIITGISGVQEMSLGKSHSVVSTKLGEMYVTGINTLGQLGNETNVDTQSFTKLDTISDVYEVSAGNTYSMAITNDGKVFGWGDYYHGTSAIRTKTNSNIPVQVGVDEFLIKTNEITIPNEETRKIDVQNSSELNVWNATTVNTAYVYSSVNDDIASVDEQGIVTAKSKGITWIKVKEVATGKEQIAVIRVTEEGTTTYPEISSGKDFAISLKADGSVWSFGYNSNGELGNNSFVGTNVPESINIIKSYAKIESGDQFTLVLRNDGTVWSFGNNTYGQLGHGDRSISKTPIMVKDLSDITKIAAGANHAVALDKYGDVFVWGRNNVGQLGTGDTKTLDVPTKLNLNGRTIIDVAAGIDNTVLVTSSGEIIVYGKEVQDVSNVKDVVKVAVGNEIIVITKSGLVQKVGSNLETIYANKDAVDIKAKNGSYMILTKAGEVYTFGENESGKLGLGVNTNVAIPTLVDFEQRVIGIEMGVNNSYIITENGNVYGAGSNQYSNLGNEKTEDTNVFVLVGKQDFKVTPDNIQMSVNDKLSIEIESERYNVFKKDTRAVEDFTWVSNDEEIMTIEEAGKIVAVKDGETTLTISETETGLAKDITVVVIPLEANRLEKISVDEIDAKVTGSMKYEVTISSDDETGELKIITKDETDEISIDDGTTWFSNGTLTKTIDIPSRETIVPITVKTTNGTEFEYELKVIKQSKIIDLNKVEVDDGVATVSAIAVSATEYVAIIEDVDTADVMVETVSDYAKVGLDNDAQSVKTATKSFNMKDLLVKTVPIKVTSESGIDLDYTLTIYKKSAIRDLEIVTANGIQAKQNKNLPEYSVIVPTGTTQVEVYAKAIYELAGVSIDGKGGDARDCTQIIKIEEDETTVSIIVSVDGLDKEFKLHIYRKIDGASLDLVYVNGKKITPVGNKYQAYVAANEIDAEVIAIAAVETSNVQIGTNPAEVGQSTVTVDTIENTTVYTILVTDGEDSTNVASYQLVITKPSGNTALKSIVVGNTEMTKEATRIPGTNTYTVSVNEKYTNLTITATADYELSQVAIADNNYRDAFDKFNAVVDNTTYTTTVKVKAQDGTEVEYTLIIEKTSSNTNIKSIKVDGIEATKSTTEADTYEVTLTRSLTEAETIVVMEHAKAKVALNNILYETNSITKTIDIDAKDVKVIINTQAEDGTLKTYYLIIHELPDNTNVTKVEVAGFVATKEQYSNTYKVRVPKTLTTYNVIVTAEDSLAMIKIGDNTASIGVSNANVTKTDGGTSVNFVVTAQDGKTQETYVLKIEDMNSNVDLSFVKINGTPIGKNDAGEYYTKVIGSTTSVVANVETADELAKVGILATPASNTLEETLNLTTNKNTFTITVIAEDGTSATYPLVVEKMSSNTDLSQVFVFVDGNSIPVSLVDGKYRAKIGNADEAEIKAVADDENSLVGIDGEAGELKESTRTVSVTEQEKTVEIIVTAEDGSTATHYVVLEKYSDDNSLLKLSKENDATQEIIQTGENSYQMVVSNELTTFNLVAETSSKVAKVKIGENEFETNITTKPVAIPEDTTEVIITVQAENGEEKEYTLTILKKCELTIKSIVVNDIEAECIDNEWIAWIEKDKDLSNVVITPTNSKAKVFVEDLADVVGKATFDASTTDEETVIKIKLSSTIDTDEVEHTLRIMKKSDNTELEYVKVAGQIGIFDEDIGKYIVKVPVQTGLYDMEVKTISQYAKVKIENQEYKTQIDTMDIDLTGKNEENLTVSVTAQDGTLKSYQVVIQKVSDDNTIKLLKVNGVEIAEIDGAYKAFIKADLTSVPVYIETTSETATIRIDQEETETIHIINNRIITMNSDEETLSIAVTAEDGSVKYYTLSIQKESNDAGLEWIKVDGKQAIEVEEDVYYVTATPGVTKVDIMASSANQYALVSINGNEATMKQNELKEYELDPDTKVIEVSVVVTAQNGKDKKTYTLKIEQVSNDASIAEIKVNGDPVVTYNAETKMYEFIIDSSIDESTIYVKANNSEATVKIDTFDPEKSASTQTVSTASDENIYTITIIAEDGTTETSQINIRKLSQDASIIKLFVEGEEITPEEDGTSYIAQVLDSLTKATVRIKAGNKDATIEIDGNALANLGEDETDIIISGHGKIEVPIKIIAEDTSITANYTLTINVVSDNKDLEYLKVGGIEVTDYDSETFTYKAFIPASSTSAKIDAKTKSPYATTAIEETIGTNTITYTTEINDDITEVSLTVTAEDDSVRTYTIVLQKKSTDADLLEVKADNELIDANEEDGIYVVEVAEDKETVKLFAKANNEYATVSIEGDTATKESQEKEITLDTGKETTVTITVTPQEGSAQNYTVKIKRVSSNNEIDYIKVNTDKVTNYNAETKTYETFIPANSASADIEVKTISQYATITSGEEEDTGILSFNVQTDAEDTEVDILVTAEDGKSEQYTLILHKISKDNTPKEIYVDGKLIEADDEGNYIAQVLETNTTSLIKVIANNKYATVKINSSTNDDDEDEQTVTLGTEKTTQVQVEITSQNGEVNTFNVTIEKVSDDVAIREILIDGLDICDYDADTKTYTAYIAEDNNLTNVSVMANSGNATVILEDVSDVGKAEKDITTTANTTNVKIIVKAESGKTENYTLEITKKSADASVLKVEVNDIEVKDPYEVSIKKLDTKAKIYIETTNKNASIKFGDEPAKQWKYTTEVTIPLDEDTMKIPFVVTSQDGKQTESHTITLSRKSNNTDISKITVNGEEVDLSKDFEAIIKNVNTSEIVITLADSDAKVCIDNGNDAKGELTQNLNTTTTTVRTIKVTAIDGTTKEYQITLIKKFTIIGKVITENKNKHLATVTVYLTGDTGIEGDSTNPREVIDSVTTAEDGTFEAVVEPGTYDVVITKSGYLTYRITDIPVTDGAIKYTGNSYLIAGDVYGNDGYIDVRDLTKVNKLARKNTAVTENDANKIYDLNEDGYINQKDLDIMNKNYNKAASSIKYRRMIEIKGNVLDGDKILGNTKITLREKNVTDESGNFEYENVPVGVYDLIVTKADGTEITNKITIVEGEQYSVNNNVITIAPDTILANITIRVNETVADISQYAENPILELQQTMPIKAKAKTKRKETEEDSEELILPVNEEYIISSEFGTRVHPVTGEVDKMHYGIDIAISLKSEVSAIAGGTVTYAGENGGYGYCIEIEHTINGEKVYSFYAHLSQIDVKVGETVEEGQIIALSGGMPGTPGAGTSTGPHLHFEIRKESGSYLSAVNPRDYFEF